MKLLLSIALIFTLSFTAYAESNTKLKLLTAEDEAEIAKGTNKSAIMDELYIKAMIKYEQQFKVSALLDACGKEGIARLIMPKPTKQFEYVYFLLKQAVSGASEDKELSKLAHGITTSEQLDISYNTQNRVAAFYAGMLYMSKQVFLTQQNTQKPSTYCTAALSVADNILKEKHVENP